MWPCREARVERAAVVLERLQDEYPDPRCALVHDSPYQLLVATILSAQSTDETVNKVTPALFERYPTPADLAGADPEELETLIHASGFFRSKAKSLIGMARAVEERYGGEIPHDLDDLVTLPGVGRKTGNVVRSVGVRAARPARRHPRRAAHPTAEAHHRDRSGQGRARPQPAHPRGGARARSRCGSSNTAAPSASLGGPAATSASSPTYAPARSRCEVRDRPVERARTAPTRARSTTNRSEATAESGVS